MNTVNSKIASQADAQASGPTARVRLLATTDLHMHLTSHNFVTDRSTQNPGLAGIATLIAQARSEALTQGAGCVLFDNGDLLQGTALGDWLAQQPVTPDHSAVTCINTLGYDALGIGNHDLDYGTPYLRAVASQMNAPMIASNLTTTNLAPIQSAALISCEVPASAKTRKQTLTIGVLSVLPEQTALWNHQQLNGVAGITSAVESLRAAVPQLRERGADLVVLLAHMGLDQEGEADDTAQTLAQIAGIDAMITGHTHRRFPGPDHDTATGVNTDAGTVQQVPTIMPGHAGSDLAVLDLNLRQDAQGQWHVEGHNSQLRRNTAGTPAAPEILAATSKTQDILRNHLSQEVGATPADLHNFFALAAPTSVCALTARAKMRLVREALRGQPDGDLPLLAATSAHSAGGRDGPDNFLHIAKGPILRRHLAGLNPYGNQVWAFKITGAELKERLEHAAKVYTQMQAGRVDQPLRNPLVPIFNFDTVFGINYSIDPTKAPGQRIASLQYDQQDVTPDQRFILAINQFRAAGGGGYASVPPDRIVLRSPVRMEDALIATLAHPDDAHWAIPPWQFAPTGGVKVTMDTSQDASAYLTEIDHLSPKVGAQTAQGFTQLHLTL